MFVSIHIPKTAGTAIAKVFDDTSHRRIMYDYGSERDERVWTCPDEVRQNRDFIRAYFQYLHGHFHYAKYAEVFADCPFLATVREPVERVISQYLHILRNGDRNFERHRPFMDGELGVVEFSRQEYIGDAQWHYLKGREVKDYDFIFVQERLNESLRKFSARFSRPEIRGYLGWTGVPVVNKKPSLLRAASENFRRGKIRITRADRRAIAKNCARDIEVYRLALEVLKSR